MIQRIQSVYLLLAILLLVLCQCTNAVSGEVDAEGATLWGLCLQSGADVLSVGLYGLALAGYSAGTLLLLYALFQYTRRVRQARLCLFGIWCVVAAFLASVAGSYSRDVLSQVTALQWIMPWAGIIGAGMARKAILSDEALVRAADRIR